MPNQRYLIRGILRTVSPLAIRSGQTWFEANVDKPRPDTPYRSGDPTWKNKETDVALIVRDSRGLPYIPGASLKGVLAEYLRRLAVHDARWRPWLHRIVGRAAVKDNGGEGGGVYFYDACIDEEWLRQRRLGGQGTDTIHGEHLPWWNERQLTYVEASVAIDRKTRTTTHGSLRHGEVVPAGVDFLCEILVDAAEEELAERILACMHGFRLPFERARVQLGSDTMNGWGRMDWANDAEKAAVFTWRPGHKPGPQSRNEMLSSKLMAPSPAPFVPARNGQALVVSVDLELRFSGPFLVNDPSRCPPRPEGDETHASPDHYPRLTGDGCALLPAASFRGSLRAQVERIARTIDPDLDRAAEDADENTMHPSPTKVAVLSLFGESERRARVWVSDFTATVASTPRRQERVAIDRWTQGAVPKLKFNRDAIESPTLRGTLRVTFDDPATLAREVGLMALALRDLCEGDIGFGHLHARCEASIRSVTTFGLSPHHGLTLTDDAAAALFIEGVIAGRKQECAQADAILDQMLEACSPSAAGTLPRTSFPVASETPTLVPLPFGKAGGEMEGKQSPLPALSRGEDEGEGYKGTNGIVAPTSFINPYHFLPLPPAEATIGTFLPRKTAEAVLLRQEEHTDAQHLRHDTYAAAQTYSGRILCQLTTKSPCVFGNRHEKLPEVPGDVSGTWSAEVHNYELDNKPAIAASTLRGAIGTLMEALSGSSMRILDNRKLSLRRERRRISVGNLFDYFPGERAELLPWNRKRERISPVEQMLGFVEGGSRDGEPAADAEPRLTAYAGRAQFSAARWIGTDAQPYLRQGSEDGWYPLKILDSPKPPCPEMYFCDANGNFAQRAHVTAAQPRGWKQYVRDPSALHAEMREHNGAWRYSWETGITQGEDARRHQKMLVQPVRAEQPFVFSIDFDNLRERELGLLVCALRPRPRFLHKLGLGKPLGLGSVEMETVGVYLVDRRRRYREDRGLIERAHNGERYHATARRPPVVPEWVAASYQREAQAQVAVEVRVADYVPRSEVTKALDVLGDPTQLDDAVADGTAIVSYPFAYAESGPTLNDLEDEHFLWFTKARGGLKKLRGKEDLLLAAWKKLPRR